MSACVQIEWGEPSIYGDCIVRRELCKGQLLYPSVRVAFNIWPQEVFQYPDRHLRLGIHLRMEGRTKPEIRSELLEQFLPKATGEPWIFVGDKNFP